MTGSAQHGVHCGPRPALSLKCPEVQPARLAVSSSAEVVGQGDGECLPAFFPPSLLPFFLSLSLLFSSTLGNLFLWFLLGLVSN